MSVIDKFATWVWKYNRWICALCILLFLGLAPFAARVTPDNSEEAISVNGDPQVALIKRVQTLFGSEDYITVTFLGADVLDTKSLQIVDKLSQFFAAQSEIERVLSVTTVSKVINQKAAEGDSIQVVPFIDPQWIKTGIPNDQKNNLLNMPLYQGLLYNKGGTAMSLMAQMIPMGSDDPKKSEVINRVRSFVNDLSVETGVKLHLFGLPVVDRAIYDVIAKENNTLTPLMVVAIMLLVIYLYRNLHITLVTLVQFLFTLGIVVGFLGVCKVHFNWLTVFAPAVMVIMSICDAVYVINEFQSADYSLPALERLKRVYKNILVPCLFTSVVNGFGFISLVTSSVRPLREYGIYIAIAVIVEFFISFTIYPILLNTPKSKARNIIKKQNPYLKAIVNGFYHLVVDYPRWVLWICIVLTVVSIWGTSRLEVNQALMNIFKRDRLELNANNELVKQGAGGGVEVHLLFDTEEPDVLLDPTLLREIESVQAQTDGFGSIAVKKALSIVDFIKYINQVWHDDNPAYYKIPDTREEVAQLLFFMEMDAEKLNLRQFVSTDYSKGIVRLFTPVADNVRMTVNSAAEAQNLINASFKGSLKPQLTAKPLVTNTVVLSLPSTVILSLITSFVFIVLAMMLLLRSVYAGLLSMLPNIMSILMMAGLMGFLGIWVNIAVAMTFAVSLGIAMDDTVNIMWRFKRNVVEMGMNRELALKNVFDEIGVPLIGSSLLLAGGYAMLIFSQLRPTTTFGIFISLSCIFALLGDMMLTPLLLLKTNAFKVKKTA